MRCAAHFLSLYAAVIPSTTGFVLHPIASSVCKTSDNSRFDPHHRTKAGEATTNGPPVRRSRASTREHSALRMMSSETAATPLTVGAEAPAFTVNDQNGVEVTLASFRGEKNVVVYFYPKDDTSGCTKEACTFRDLKSEYDALDCVVLGVSADDEASHISFINKLGLNFSLLADTNKTMVKAYGATKAGDKIQRSTVLVDKEGKIAAVWNPVTTAETHPNDVLEKLKEIA